jgi:UDP-glucose 4-epimerase
MRVLITGANGFVGRSLVPALTSLGHQVRATARYGSEIPAQAGVEAHYHNDFADGVDWTPLLAGCDVVVHLAGIAHIGAGMSADHYDRVNHRGTIALAQAAQSAGISRFVFISSIRAQSGPTSSIVQTEDTIPNPVEPYGKSKLAAEQALRALSLPHVILRPTLVYGPGVKGNFSELLRYARLSVPLPFGALKQQRSLLNVDALISAVTFALQSSAAINQTFVVADPAPVSVAQMIAALRRGLGRSPGLIPVPRAILRAALTLIGKGDALDRIDGRLIASPAKLITKGWHPPSDTETSLTAMARKMTEALN